MAIRKSTVIRYQNAAVALRARLLDSPYIDHKEFTSTHVISAGFFNYMLDAGFIRKTGKRSYSWSGRLITYIAIKEMLEEVNKQRSVPPTMPSQTFPTDSANEAFVGYTLKEKDSCAFKPSDQDRITALEQRVASLEQLLIRRSIA